MGERLDELCETAADEQENGRSKKSRHARRWALLVVVLSVAALAWSCVFHGNLTRKPVGFLTTNDAVIALRLGGGRTTAGDDKPYYDGWIVLLDAQGRGQVASVDEINGGDVLWSDRGVFYGSPSQDYVTTDSGTQQTTWQFTRRGDVQRYALPDGALVAVRRESNDYHIGTLFPDGTHASVETEGVGRGIGQCGGRIVAITTTEKSESIKSAAFEAYAAQASDEDVVPEVLTAVVQLNVPDGDAPRILAVAPAIDNLLTVHRMLACEGDVITLQSLEEVKPGTPDNMTVHELYRWVPLRWDLSTGERTYIPLTGDDGEPFEFGSKEAFYGLTSIQVGSEYRMVKWDGDALAVDLTSGRARRLFYTNPRMPVSGSYWMTYQVDKDGVYALGESHKDHVITLFFMPWDGKEWREIFTTDKLAGYLKEGWFSGELKVQSFAVRPGWNGGAQ